MLRADGDFICWCLHRLPIFPLLLVGDQSSLDEDVVQEDLDDGVVAGADLPAHLLTAADDVFST